MTDLAAIDPEADEITEFAWLNPSAIHLVGKGANAYSTLVAKAIDESVNGDGQRSHDPQRRDPMAADEAFKQLETEVAHAPDAASKARAAHELILARFMGAEYGRSPSRPGQAVPLFGSTDPTGAIKARTVPQPNLPAGGNQHPDGISAPASDAPGLDAFWRAAGELGLDRALGRDRVRGTLPDRNLAAHNSRAAMQAGLAMRDLHIARAMKVGRQIATKEGRDMTYADFVEAARRLGTPN